MERTEAPGIIMQTKNTTRIKQEHSFVLQESSEHNVFSVVVEPGFRASDGIRISAEAIRKASYKFMCDYQSLYYRHDGPAKAHVIESYVVRQDFTLPSGMVVKQGSWWLGTHIKDTDLWAEIESGEIRGYSLGGFIFEVEEDGAGGVGAGDSRVGIDDMSMRQEKKKNTPPSISVQQDESTNSIASQSEPEFISPGDQYPFDPNTNIVTSLEVYEVSFAKFPKNGAQQFAIIQESDYLELQKLQEQNKRGKSETKADEVESQAGEGIILEGKEKTDSKEAGIRKELGKSLGESEESSIELEDSENLEDLEDKVENNAEDQEGEDNMKVPATKVQQDTPATNVNANPTPAPTPAPATTPAITPVVAPVTTPAPAAPAAAASPIGVSQEEHSRVVQEVRALRNSVRRSKIEQEVKRDMKNLPGKQEDIVGILLEMDADTNPTHKKVRDLLIQCDRIIKKSKMFQEKGKSSGGEGRVKKSAFERIEQEAKKMQLKDPKLRADEAFDKIIALKPELFQEYQDESNGVGGKGRAISQEEEDLIEQEEADREDRDGDGTDPGDGDSGEEDDGDDE